ncbi:hypothetical protein ACWDOR_40175 [Streptosporangium canum]
MRERGRLIFGGVDLQARKTPGFDEEKNADVEAVVRYWHGSSAVRQRMHALAGASASIVLFQEFIP